MIIKSFIFTKFLILFFYLGLVANAQQHVVKDSILRVEFYILPRSLSTRHSLSAIDVKTYSTNVKGKFLRKSVANDHKLFGHLSATDTYLGNQLPNVNIDVRLLMEVHYLDGNERQIAIARSNIVSVDGIVYDLHNSREFMKPIRKYIPTRFGW